MSSLVKVTIFYEREGVQYYGMVRNWPFDLNDVVTDINATDEMSKQAGGPRFLFGAIKRHKDMPEAQYYTKELFLRKIKEVIYVEFITELKRNFGARRSQPLQEYT